MAVVCGLSLAFFAGTNLGEGVTHDVVRRPVELFLEGGHAEGHAEEVDGVARPREPTWEGDGEHGGPGRAAGAGY